MYLFDQSSQGSYKMKLSKHVLMTPEYPFTHLAHGKGQEQWREEEWCLS